ncbi:hypothetical protein [Hymenobacter koreensis]
MAELRLKFIDNTLMRSNEEMLQANRYVVRGIEARTQKNQYPPSPADVAILRQAEAVHDSTQQLVTHLHELREQLLSRTGNQTRFQELDGRLEVAALLGEEPGQGNASTLSLRLSRYYRYLHQVAPAAQAGHSVTDFADASVAAALATLARYEAQVLLREEAALNVLEAKVRAALPKPNFRLLASAESQTVAPGTTYRAELMLAQALSLPSRGLTMSANGQPVTVGTDGFAPVTFTAPDRPGQHYWDGAIRYQVGSRDSVFRVRVPYTVLRKN